MSWLGSQVLSLVANRVGISRDALDKHVAAFLDLVKKPSLQSLSKNGFEAKYLLTTDHAFMIFFAKSAGSKFSTAQNLYAFFCLLINENPLSDLPGITEQGLVDIFFKLANHLKLSEEQMFEVINFISDVSHGWLKGYRINPNVVYQRYLEAILADDKLHPGIETLAIDERPAPENIKALGYYFDDGVPTITDKEAFPCDEHDGGLALKAQYLADIKAFTLHINKYMQKDIAVPEQYTDILTGITMRYLLHLKQRKGFSTSELIITSLAPLMTMPELLETPLLLNRVLQMAVSMIDVSKFDLDELLFKLMTQYKSSPYALKVFYELLTLWHRLPEQELFKAMTSSLSKIQKTIMICQSIDVHLNKGERVLPLMLLDYYLDKATRVEYIEAVLLNKSLMSFDAKLFLIQNYHVDLQKTDKSDRTMFSFVDDEGKHHLMKLGLRPSVVDCRLLMENLLGGLSDDYERIKSKADLARSLPEGKGDLRLYYDQNRLKALLYQYRNDPLALELLLDLHVPIDVTYSQSHLWGFYSSSHTIADLTSEPKCQALLAQRSEVKDDNPADGILFDAVP